MRGIPQAGQDPHDCVQSLDAPPDASFGAQMGGRDRAGSRGPKGHPSQSGGGQPATAAFQWEGSPSFGDIN